LESDWNSDWPKSGPEILWKTNVGTGFSCFAIRDNRLYTMGHRGGIDTVYALATETGQPVWTFDYEAPLIEKGAEGGPTSTPSIHNGLVYTLSRGGYLLCLNEATGAKVWDRDLVKDFDPEPNSYGWAGSPLATDDFVIVDAGPIIAFDPLTGMTLWKTEDRQAGYSSPVKFTLGERGYLANFTSDSLRILDLKKGKEVSSASWETSSKVNVATPIVHDDKIFISSGFGMGCALYDMSDPASPTQIYRNWNMHTHFNSCVLWNGHLYGFDGHVTRDEGYLTCLDFETGETRWKERGVRKGSLMIADGKIVALEETGVLIVAEATPEGYNELSRAHVLGGRCWTPPVLCDGRIYCRNAKGDLICLDVERVE
jgi:outer membrane protein assembly factor BamB